MRVLYVFVCVLSMLSFTFRRTVTCSTCTTTTRPPRSQKTHALSLLLASCRKVTYPGLDAVDGFAHQLTGAWLEPQSAFGYRIFADFKEALVEEVGAGDATPVIRVREQ